MEVDHRRLEEEDKRQNKRLEGIEESIEKLTDTIAALTGNTINSLALSTEKLSVSMQNLIAAEEDTKNRINEIEKRPGKRWETLISGILGAMAGALGAAVAAGVIR